MGRTRQGGFGPSAGPESPRSSVLQLPLQPLERLPTTRVQSLLGEFDLDTLQSALDSTLSASLAMLTW